MWTSHWESNLTALQTFLLHPPLHALQYKAWIQHPHPPSTFWSEEVAEGFWTVGWDDTEHKEELSNKVPTNISSTYDYLCVCDASASFNSAVLLTL